ncbi:X-element [Scenedesmus sp. PABB004]|nr:X-element [Scenedesmus sp. PABB004]
MRTAGDGPVVGDQQIADALAGQCASIGDQAAFAAGADFDEQHRQLVEADVARLRAEASHAAEGRTSLSAPITIDDIADQASTLKNNRAPSPLDDFELEVKAQADGVVRPIYKRSDRAEPANYRPITLGSTVDKLYNLVLNARLVPHLQQGDRLHDAQQGFRPGRNAQDNVFILTSCLAARRAQGLDSYVLFLDIHKAYDTVWRAGLLWQLWQWGVRGKLFRVLAQMTDGPRSRVLHRSALSAAYQPGMGWEQGDTLAATMFTVLVDAVLREVWAAHPGVPLPAPAAALPAGAAAPAPHAAPGDKLVALMYADDCAGVAGSPE